MRSPGIAVIAEDDADISDLIQMVLTQSGFTVVVAPDGFQAIEAVREHQPVLTTLDVNMPGIDGFAVAKQLRRFSETYLIMITSLTEEIDIIRGFEAGADDYLVKPFSPRELRARADAMVRRLSFAPAAPQPAAQPAALPEAESWVAAAAREFRGSVGEKPPRPHPIPSAVPPPAAPATPPVAPAPAPVAPAPVAPTPAAPAPVAPAPAAPAPAPAPAASVARAPETEQTEGVLRFGELRVDTVNGTASLRGSALELTRPESDVLISLLRTGRRVRSKADLVLTMRGQDYVTSYFVNEADKRAVESHVASLRRKLDDDGATPRYIETVRGVGYRMVERG